MRIDASSEPLIRRYLLSSVSEEEREQVETRLMTDDDFFQQISLVEDELVEAYLDEELARADRLRFEETFLCAPERQHKLRFTKALRIRAASAAKQGMSQADGAAHRWYEALTGLFNVSRPVLAYSLASTLLMLGGGGAWTLVQVGGLKDQISGLQAQRQIKEARLLAQFETERARADQIAGLLRQEQGKRAPTQIAMATQPWFTVFPGAQRSAQATQRVEIPKDAILVGLRLDLAENWKETYRVVLSIGGKEALSRSNLKAAVGDKEITISFRVPAADLPSGYCEVGLYGSGDNEILETYSFRVVRIP